MTAMPLHKALWMLLTAAAGGCAIRAAVHPLELPSPAVPAAMVVVPPAGAIAVPESVVASAIRQAGFRSARTLSAVRRSSPSSDGAMADPSKPLPRLVGLVLGHPSTALITGVPGEAGTRILTQGDTAGGLRIRSISPHRVIVAGFDTAWTLRPPEDPE